MKPGTTAVLPSARWSRSVATSKERNRLAAANALLDRGFGPLQQIDASIVAKKLTELTSADLDYLQARIVTEGLPAPDPVVDLDPAPALGSEPHVGST